jgi:hypothetical protein
MTLAGRLATLERRATDARVRVQADRLAREYDLPADAVYESMRHVLRIGVPAALRELAAEWGISVEEAEREVMATMEGRS